MEIGSLIQDVPEGVWIEFDADARVKIRPMTPKISKEFIGQCTKKKWRKGVMVEDVDRDKCDRLINAHVVEDWEGFTVSGKPLKKTDANVQLLLDNWSEFKTFVFDAAFNIRKYLKDQGVKEAKN